MMSQLQRGVCRAAPGQALGWGILRCGCLWPQPPLPNQGAELGEGLISCENK